MNNKKMIIMIMNKWINDNEIIIIIIIMKMKIMK